MRDRRAEPAQRESFTDQLRKASQDTSTQSAKPDEASRPRTGDDDNAADVAATSPPGQTDTSQPATGEQSTTSDAAANQPTESAALRTDHVASTADQVSTLANAAQTGSQSTSTNADGVTFNHGAQETPTPTKSQANLNTPATLTVERNTAATDTTTQNARVAASNESVQTPTDTAQQSAVAAVQVSATARHARTIDGSASTLTNASSPVDSGPVRSDTANAATTTNTLPKEQAPTTSEPSHHLQKQVREALLAGAKTDTTDATPAERRAGQLNASLRFEQSAAQGQALTPDASTTPTVQPGAAAGLTSALDVGVTSRPAGGEILLPSGQAVDEPATTNSIVRGLSALVNQRGGVMHMRLNPPELGQLRVQMSIQQGAVTAQFQAATSQAQTVLERNLATLRTALERHGLTVERLTVQVHQPAQSNNTAGQQMNDHAADQSGQHQHDAGGGASRGRDDQSPHDRQPQSYAQFASEENDAGNFDELHAGATAGAST